MEAIGEITGASTACGVGSRALSEASAVGAFIPGDPVPTAAELGGGVETAKIGVIMREAPRGGRDEGLQRGSREPAVNWCCVRAGQSHSGMSIVMRLSYRSRTQLCRQCDV